MRNIALCDMRCDTRLGRHIEDYAFSTGRLELGKGKCGRPRSRDEENRRARQKTALPVAPKLARSLPTGTDA